MRSLKTVGFILALSAIALGSDPATFSSRSPVVLYHFVRGAAILNRHADELDRKDGSGKKVRDAFSSTVGLNDVDAVVFLALALELDAQFAALDQKAAEVIANAKKVRTSEGLIPPPPAELATLQQQKNDLMRTLASVLDQSQVSDGGKAAIAHYLARAAAKTSQTYLKF